MARLAESGGGALGVESRRALLGQIQRTYGNHFAAWVVGGLQQSAEPVPKTPTRLTAFDPTIPAHAGSPPPSTASDLWSLPHPTSPGTSSPYDSAEKESATKVKQAAPITVSGRTTAQEGTGGGGVFRQVAEQGKDGKTPNRQQSPYITRNMGSVGDSQTEPAMRAQEAGIAQGSPSRSAPSWSTSLAARSAAFQGGPPAKQGPPGRGTTAPQVSATVAADEIDISKGVLAIPTEVAGSVAEGGEMDVKVRLPALAQGELKLRRRGNRFSSARDQAILLSHPALARFCAATPTVLVLHVANDVVTGWVGLGEPGPVKGGARSLFDAMAKGADLLGWAGLSGITISSFHNRFADGLIDVRVESLAFTVGEFLSGTGSLALDSKALSFDGAAKIQIPGGSGGDLQIKKDPSGALSGKLDMQVSIGSVAGTVTATLASGFVSIMGSVAYNGDRLSGKVTLVATDEVTARDITLKKPESGAEVPIELPGPDKPAKPGKRAYCGWGQLTFRVTDWLAGTATVIVNSKGQATIVGEIAPPKEFILFEPKEWVKRLVKIEIRAGYGIPVVGQVGLFANISLDAIAKVGPGKLYKIKLSGAYSTDPRVPKQLSIEGTLNISAFAGLRARAEAGLVVTILAHDIKAGVGLFAIAGVRGYVEATPRIGIREPTPGNRQYYIQGHLEIAAQPVLGFGGDLFVELETPWWSPLSDKRWTWPLFSLEYPLPGEFGIGADVDYVLGSKQWPKIEFGEVNFDSSKFLTDVMNDNTDTGKGGEVKKQGEWQEGLGGGGPGGAKNKGGKGKTPGELGVDNEPVGETLTFSDGKESHRLWFEEKPGEATLMVSSQEETVSSRLKKLDGQVKLLLEGEQGKARGLIGKATSLLPSVGNEAKQVAAMKEAERRAEETYKKYGKDKRKKKGSKPNRRDKNKQLKADERKLKEMLADLFTLLLAVPFEPINRSPEMHGGTESLAVVNDQKHPGLRIAKLKGTAKLVELAYAYAPLAPLKIDPTGVHRVKKSQKDLEPQIEKIEKIPIREGKINAKNQKWLEGAAKSASDLVSSLGRALQVSNLQRAHQWARGMAEHEAYIHKMNEREADAEKLKHGLAPIQARFGFTRLVLIEDGVGYAIAAEMNPKGKRKMPDNQYVYKDKIKPHIPDDAVDPIKFRNFKKSTRGNSHLYCRDTNDTEWFWIATGRTTGRWQKTNDNEFQRKAEEAARKKVERDNPTYKSLVADDKGLTESGFDVFGIVPGDKKALDLLIIGEVKAFKGEASRYIQYLPKNLVGTKQPSGRERENKLSAITDNMRETLERALAQPTGKRGEKLVERTLAALKAGNVQIIFYLAGSATISEATILKVQTRVRQVLSGFLQTKFKMKTEEANKIVQKVTVTIARRLRVRQ